MGSGGDPALPVAVGDLQGVSGRGGEIMNDAQAATPAVSVLMPVWNADPGLLREAIASILRQTLSDFELIVVEDPSPQSAQGIVEAFADPRIRYFGNSQRTSLVEQRNRSLAEARAPLAALMDADDVADPERLATQAAFLREHPEVDVVGSQLAIIDETGRHLGYRAYPTAPRDIHRAMRRFNALAQPAVMLRRKVVLDAGGYQHPRLVYTEDYELWCRLAVRGVQFANLPQPLLRYRIHSTSGKTRSTKVLLRNTLTIKRMYWKGQMGLVDHLRMWAERALLWLPARWIRGLFVRYQFRKTLPHEILYVHEPRPLGSGSAAAP
jgi:glycosyltransferase involved in cell wall biosynthesis